ncbi:uncharacterized protein LOC130716766 [Lotus japonicus]|uniref:uncharacterized protein LOC130716766 n=1 Tax=Lotus japonicus TaxID=34305 RepID=UPI00258DA4D7|nr:uncharacterized protein LOC130716766 [Lotus japonicus]
MLLSLFFLLSLIFNICYAANCLPPSVTSNLYEKVCFDTGNSTSSTNPCPITNRCLKLLEPYPQITSAKDYVTLCKFYLKVAIENATKVHNYFNEVMKKNSSSEALKLCATVYYDGFVNELKASLADLVRDPSSANYDAFTAGDGINACNSLLDNEKISNPILHTLNSDMSFLVVVAFFATYNLPGQ